MPKDTQADLRRVSEKRKRARNEAFRIAAEQLQPALGIKFRCYEWTGTARDAYRTQWGGHPPPRPEFTWDWEQLHETYRRDIDRFIMAVWAAEDRLSALSLIKLSNSSVMVEIAEGDPRPDCPLIGKRVLICFQVATLYGQALGKSRIRIEPANEELREHYRMQYGFSLEPGKPVGRYLYKEI